MKATPHRLKSGRSRTKPILFIISVLLLLISALPKLPPVDGSPGGWFTVLWLLLSLVIIGANLYRLLGVSQSDTIRPVKPSDWMRMRSVAAAERQQEREYDPGR